MKMKKMLATVAAVAAVVSLSVDCVAACVDNASGYRAFQQHADIDVVAVSGDERRGRDGRCEARRPRDHDCRAGREPVEAEAAVLGEHRIRVQVH